MRKVLSISIYEVPAFRITSGGNAAREERSEVGIGYREKGFLGRFESKTAYVELNNICHVPRIRRARKKPKPRCKMTVPPAIFSPKIRHS